MRAKREHLHRDRALGSDLAGDAVAVAGEDGEGLDGAQSSAQGSLGSRGDHGPGPRRRVAAGYGDDDPLVVIWRKELFL